MPVIQQIQGLEILDSRGRPTVQATVEFSSGAKGTVSVPSGASTGQAEALELRDGDPNRYRGLGCRKAVGHVNQEIKSALINRSVEDQTILDQHLLDLDDTSNKANLGANAILAVSLAFARANAQEKKQPLYHHFASLIDEAAASTLPRPTINLFSGGKHAGGQVPIQDVLIVANRAHTIDEALATTYAVYQAAADLSQEKYGARALTADEGGLAPPFTSATAMLDDAVQAIERAGYRPAEDVSLAVDVASSHFYKDGRYHFDKAPEPAEAMIDHLLGWVNRYPIISLEDGLAEDDWHNWSTLTTKIDGRALVLGDDLLCTNPSRIQRAIDTQAADALLLKVNQIGTLSEAATAYKLARSANWRVTISARSGETEDNWLADLAVGWGGDQIKIGSITQSERLAKYNRLLAIEAETNLPLVAWPNS
ncbi:MAG: phosphopyruvate hydratase [Chloroflexota bacterium]